MPRLGLDSVEISNASVSPRSRLKRPRAHPWHFSNVYKIMLRYATSVQPQF